MNNDEIWKPVKGYENRYEVSNLGRVRSHWCRTNEGVKVLKAVKLNNGYLRVSLYKDGKRRHHFVHRLVYEAFRGLIPSGMEINHLDENKLNNWLDNLEVCTRKENMNYGTRNERAGKANKKANINHPSLSKPVHQIDKQTGEILNTFPSCMEAERQTGIKNSSIVSCCKGNPKHSHAGGFIWRYVDVNNKTN